MLASACGNSWQFTGRTAVGARVRFRYPNQRGGTHRGGRHCWRRRPGGGRRAHPGMGAARLRQWPVQEREARADRRPLANARLAKAGRCLRWRAGERRAVGRIRCRFTPAAGLYNQPAGRAARPGTSGVLAPSQIDHHPLRRSSSPRCGPSCRRQFLKRSAGTSRSRVTATSTSSQSFASELAFSSVVRSICVLLTPVLLVFDFGSARTGRRWAGTSASVSESVVLRQHVSSANGCPCASPDPAC